MNELTEDMKVQYTQRLKQVVKKGSTVYTAEKASTKAASTNVSVLVVFGKQVLNISQDVASVLQLKYSMDTDSVLIRSNANHLVGMLARTLFIGDESYYFLTQRSL